MEKEFNLRNEEIKNCTNAEELKKLAAGHDITLTDEQANEFLAAMQSGELTDEALANVVGGQIGFPLHPQH